MNFSQPTPHVARRLSLTTLPLGILPIAFVLGLFVQGLFVQGLFVQGLFVQSVGAAEFHLVEETVRGAWIGEADGALHILTDEGKKRTFERNDLLWIDWSVEVPKKHAKRVIRERFLEERRKIARKLIQSLERSGVEERPSLIAKFDGFDEAQSLHAFSGGLDSRAEHVRELSFGRLATFQSEAAVVPFIRVYLKSSDPAYAARALEQAKQMDPDLTRRIFEFVSMSAPMPYRVKSVETLGALGDRAALPSLVRVLHSVGIDIRATVARTKSIDEVPVNLGGITQAAQNVTIDLPQLELIEINSSLRVPVEALRRLEAVTSQALHTLSGESHGTNVGAWAKMVREAAQAAQAAQAEKAEKSEKAVAAPKKQGD